MNNNYFQKIAVLISLTLTLIINSLAGSTNIIGGVNTKEISDMYPTEITPAGYVFSIWGIIYIGLVSYTIYNFLRKDTSNSNKMMNGLFLLSNALNILWLYFWQNNQIIATLPIMLLLLVNLILITKNNLNISFNLRSKEYWLQRVPFEIYTAWISVATIVNTAVFIKFFVLLKDQPTIQCIKAPCQISVSLFGINEMIWTYIMIGVAIALGLFMLKKYKSWPFIIVTIWAIIGILR